MMLEQLLWKDNKVGCTLSLLRVWTSISQYTLVCISCKPNGLESPGKSFRWLFIRLVCGCPYQIVLIDWPGRPQVGLGCRRSQPWASKGQRWAASSVSLVSQVKWFPPTLFFVGVLLQQQKDTRKVRSSPLRLSCGEVSDRFYSSFVLLFLLPKYSLSCIVLSGLEPLVPASRSWVLS